MPSTITVRTAGIPVSREVLKIIATLKRARTFIPKGVQQLVLSLSDVMMFTIIGKD